MAERRLETPSYLLDVGWSRMTELFSMLAAQEIILRNLEELLFARNDSQKIHCC